jgi:hypothetical protein
MHLRYLLCGAVRPCDYQLTVAQARLVM